MKVCPQCDTSNFEANRICKQCQYVFFEAKPLLQSVEHKIKPAYLLLVLIAVFITLGLLVANSLGIFREVSFGTDAERGARVLFGGIVGIILMMVIVILSAVFYFLLTIIAALSGHHKVIAIAVLNVLIGWTFIGWVASMVCLLSPQQ